MQRLEAVVKVQKRKLLKRRVRGRRTVDELSWQGGMLAGRQAGRQSRPRTVQV